MIEESISCVPVAGKTNVWKFELDYPELPDVNLSEKYKCGANSNKNIAIKSTTNLRNKLDKEGFLDEFHTQITTAIEKGEFVIVTPEVAKAHDGLAMSYQLINFVHKTSSTSTKLRVISNSSISRHGGSLNDNLAVGVNSMNATLDVLAGWCAYGYAMLTDLSSAYRSVRTKAKTNSLRRFYWYSNPNDPTTMIELMVVVANFGDKPAGRVLDICNVRISEDPGISKETSQFLKER